MCRAFNLFAVFAMTVLASGQNQPQISLVGVGGTFPFPLYSRWIKEYAKLHPGIDVRYLPAGSEEGIRQASNGTADFGASDAPMTGEQRSAARKKVLHLPTIVGAVVPIYNLPGVTRELRFTAPVLAGIYLGHILKWSDPEIAACNPGVVLPEKDIAVVHREDASGTTYVWTDYLAKVSGEWKSRVGSGTSVSWPVGRASEKGSGGLIALIAQTPYSIGYVELTLAKQANARFGQVRNAAGKFVEADLTSLSAAASAGSTRAESDQFRISLTNTACDTCYPIASFTWLLVPTEMTGEKKAALKSFMRWALTDGQSFAEGLDYGRVPTHVVQKELIALDKL